ncbi:unnamed protein product, partial [Staurois parvus]
GPPYRPPHAAARPVICHGPPYRHPHAAARPVICHGPLYQPPNAAARSIEVSWVPVRPPIAAVSKIATLCHVPLSGLLTLLVGFHFCHRVLYGPHCCSASPPPHCGSHTLVLAPCDCPNE